MSEKFNENLIFRLSTQEGLTNEAWYSSLDTKQQIRQEYIVNDPGFEEVPDLKSFQLNCTK